MTNTSGLILNRYKPEGQRGQIAGEGISGVVIKASDTLGIHGMVAIKRPNPMLSLVERRKKNAQIKRESEALRRLTHGAACRYIDDADWQDTRDHCLIIEWANGQQLEDRLRNLENSGDLLPQGEALEILGQLADLLSHAHNQGVIHNDLDAKHLFWLTSGTVPQLTVIDWANCALSGDAKPIATAADDLQQYGELMHRMLTGSTLAYAVRLGGEENWRVEMVDKQLPEGLQLIIARATARDTRGSYDHFRELLEDLYRFHHLHEAPYRNRLAEIDGLLRKNSTDSLEQAEGLIDKISIWNPTLVSAQRALLEQLRRERAENMARIGGKTSLMAEQWETAQDEIEDVFGLDVQTMPQVEEQYIYLVARLMDNLEPTSSQYGLGKDVVDELFNKSARNENKALDKVLLLHGRDIPDNDLLIDVLSHQTERRYPLRSRIRQALT